MDSFVEISCNVIQMFIWTWFITEFFGTNRSPILAKIGFILAWLITTLEITFINHIVVYDGFLTGFIVLTFIAYARLFLRGNLGSHIFIGLYSVAVIFTISTVILFIASYISGVGTKSQIADFTLTRIIVLYVCRICEILVFRYIVRVNSVYKFDKKDWLLFIGLPLSTWAGLTFAMQSTIDSEAILPQMFYIALIMVAINIAIYYFLVKIKKDEEIRLDYELLKLEKNNKAETVKDLMAMSDNIDAQKHDMEKHFLAIIAMAEVGKNDEIKQYAKTIVKEKINSVQQRIITDNEVFNAIINAKLAVCQQENIDINISVDNEAVNFIKNTDIAVLFGNLLENAIEASTKTDNPRILLKVLLQDEYISVYIENSYDNKYSNISLITSKKDVGKHGIGTKNIKRIVDDNSGMIDYFISDTGMFCCDILLKKS